jgi:hypothetical protein
VQFVGCVVSSTGGRARKIFGVGGLDIALIICELYYWNYYYHHHCDCCCCYYYYY